MKHLATILCAAAAALVVGCAVNKPVVYYQYKKGESNFESAKAKCFARALSESRKIDCSAVCRNLSFAPYETPQAFQGESRSILAEISPGFLKILEQQRQDRIYRQNAVRCDACLARKNQPSFPHYQACLAKLGWVPCSQGGLHLPECQ